MKGGFKAKSETGPTVPAPKIGGDHGAQRLARLIQNFPATGSGGTFLGDDADYKVDRVNVKQATPMPALDSDGDSDGD